MVSIAQIDSLKNHRKRHFYRLVGALLYLITSIAYSATALYSSSSGQLIEHGGLLYLEDENGQRNIDELRFLPNQAWVQSDNPSPSFGLTNSHYWFKFRIKNLQSTSENYVVAVNYQALDYVDFYSFAVDSGEQMSHFKTGDKRPFSSRPIEHLSFAFPVELKAGESRDVFLKVSSQGNIALPLSIWQFESFYERQKYFFIMLGFLVGMMLVTGIHNLFVYLRTRESIFISFGLFALSVAFLFSIQSGFTYLYFWPSAPRWNELSILLAISFATASYLNFASSFLGFKGALYQTTYVAILLAVVSPSLYWLGSYTTALASGLAMAVVSCLATLILSIVLAFRRVKYARIFALAWSAFAIGATLSALIRFELVPYNFFTENAAFIGALTTVIVFSILVADRINWERSERIDAQNAAIKSLEKYETLFRESVEGIFTVAMSGEILSMNPALLKMLDYEDIDQLRDIERCFSGIFKDENQYNEILAKVRAQHKLMDCEVELVDRKGNAFWASLSMRLSEIMAQGGVSKIKIEGAIVNISARKESEQKLAYLASHDPLTDIYNRRDFEVRLREALSSLKDVPYHHTMLYMDLDQFKVVNDTCGHSAGDKLLKELTKIFVKTLGAKGVIARLGGDEFGVLLPFQDKHIAHETAESLLKVVQEYRFVHSDKVFTLGVSIGLVELSSNFSSVEDVMSLADTACYTAKDEGRNRIHVYSADNVELAKRRTEMEIVSAVNTALATDRFRLVRQAIVSTQNPSDIVGYEILVRMMEEDGLMVAPSKFIPAAERYSVMPYVDRWVLEHAFAWLADSPSALHDAHCYSLNLSGQSLGDEKFKLFLSNLFEHHRVPYDRICFEITETTAIQSLHNTVQFIELFRNKGCMFSLDDFGSGFSSYGYLKNLPVDHLKIDGSFVRNMDEDQVDFAMVKSITSVAQAMGKKTIAEFVENEATVERLKEVGVDFIQGYYIGEPELIEATGLYRAELYKHL